MPLAESVDSETTAPAPALPPAPGGGSSLARLMRAALWMLVLLAAAVGAASWESLQRAASHLEIVPVLLFVVVCSFAALLYAKTRQISEVQGALKGLQDQQSTLTAAMEAQKLLQTVAASREAFRDLIDSFDSAVFTLSLDGRVRAANKAFVKAVGRSFEGVIGKPLSDFLAQPSPAELQAALPTFLEKRSWFGLVRAHLSTTDQWRYFECTLHPVLQDDSVLAVTVIADDVTAERERELLFSALFETLQEPVWVSTCEGRLLDLNQGMASMLAVDQRQQLLGADLLAMVLGPERDALQEAMRRRQPIRDFDLTLARSDGAPVACIANATPVVDVSGEARYHGTFTDISKRRAMERQLAYEQRFKEQLIASFPDAIITLDAQGRFTFVSPRAEILFGHPANSLLGRPFIELFDPQDDSPIASLLRDCAFDPGTACTRELHPQVGSDGLWRTVQMRATALLDDRQQLAGLVASLRDVTEEKQLEQQIIAQERMAAVGQMIEGFAHELNNPLTAMVGACELMRQEELPAPAAHHLDLLESQTSRAREVVQNLILFSRPAVEGSATVDVGKLVERTVSLRRHSLRAKNVTVDLGMAAPLPSIRAVPGQIMQVFLNLLINAEDACCAGGRQGGTVRIRTGSDAGFVWCTFQDDGPGVQPADANLIFEPFFTTKGPRGGAGLGLSICRSIIQAHAGKIEVSSAPGGGAVFRVALPRPSPGRGKIGSVRSEAQGRH